MRDAVQAIEGLGETRAGIASLTGLPTSCVREYLATGTLELGADETLRFPLGRSGQS
jgi:hypothetical protein